MKKLLKFIKRAAEKFWVRLVLLAGCIVGIFAIGGAFESGKTAGAKIVEIITSVDVLSIFLAAAVSLIVADVVIKIRHTLEESNKIEDDHHKIICKYNKHNKSSDNDVKTENLFDKNGTFMYLRSLPPVDKRKRGKNPVRDKESDAYKNREKDIDAYMNKNMLYLPSVSVYTNVLGNTSLEFDDKAEFFALPTFVRENILKLMEAHKASNVSNGVTVRLNDIDCVDNVLTLHTERSHYFDMLITNRCMDYRPDDGVSVREVLEFGDSVSPLHHSELGNQIGINGLVFTDDGYLLIEKRGNKKTTWKDKFAQPISLAMKLKDTGLGIDDVFGKTSDDANGVFEKIILKTLENNFGITKSDLLGFDIKTNFFGIARDLLEGGKPNMYFYVTVNKTADEFKTFLEDKFEKACDVYENKKKPDEALPKVNREKLDSDYYLMFYEDIAIDYNYELKIKAAKLKHIKRKYTPRVSKLASRREGRSYRIKRAIGGSIKKECGEALLACLSYAEACRVRLTADLNEQRSSAKENGNER